jgi:hypothetical protein
MDKGATDAEVCEPFVATCEDAVLSPPDLGVDADACVDSVLYHGYALCGSRLGGCRGIVAGSGGWQPLLHGLRHDPHDTLGRRKKL